MKYEGPKYTEWVDRVQELVKGGFFNDDIQSINLYQGQDLFTAKKAAIVTSVQPQITSFYRTMGGADTVGVMRSPAFGTGKFANSFGAPAQVLLLTKFSSHKEEAAAFLKFLHTPEMMHLMYQESGAICPDNKFDTSWFNTETDKTMWHWQQTLPNFWFQYYYPLPFETGGVHRACSSCGRRTAASSRRCRRCRARSASGASRRRPRFRPTSSGSRSRFDGDPQ